MERTATGIGDQVLAAVMRRWEAALCRIDARDERGALDIANTMDEFCEAAARARDRAAGSGSRGLRCRTCPAFSDPGECLGFVGGLNHAVLNGRWTAARRLVEDHPRTLARPAGRCRRPPDSPRT